MTEPRRSGRQRKVNPKYTNDGWDKDTLRVLRASFESSGSSPDEDSASLEQEEDVDLAVKNGRVIVASSPEDDFSLASVVRSQSSDIDTPSDNDENMSLASNDGIPNGVRPHKKHRFPHPGTTSAIAHSRGVQPTPHTAAKSSIYPSTFGPAIYDLCDVIQARDTWLRGRDATIPSRRTLHSAISQSKSTQGSVSEDEDRGLPNDPISINVEQMQQIQKHREIGDEEMHQKYLLQPKTSHSVVLGPWERQQQFGLEYGHPLDLGQAWLKNETENRPHQDPVAQHRYHEGWLINVGEKVQCLAWAPCTGSHQYLAVVARCTSHQRQFTKREEPARPAFHPSPKYPSSIQIWCFRTKPTSIPGVSILAMNIEPRLAVVLGTEWGNIRHVEWCPSNHGTKVADSDLGNSHAIIGLLGVVSSDGHARAITVPRPVDHDSPKPIGLRIDKAGLVIVPANDTIFTTLTFATSTDLILGASDGSVHLFDLSEPVTENSMPQSFMKQQLGHTYVMSLCMASPGPFSTFVASTSASGDLTLTDLRCPEQDKVHIPRACIPTRQLFYAPFTRSFITILDRAGNTQIDASSACFVVCHHLRQFPNSLKIAKLPHHSGGATALAGSPWHPCILIGNARGQVFATNYLRKVLSYGRTGRSKAAGAYLQKIYEYDWRPLTPEERVNTGSPATNDEPDLYHGRDVPPGVSRFNEGFKPEKVEVGNISSKTKKASKKDLGAAEAIFEEEQAVTAMAWNPNASCAGLVAVGWGSGIVRVQDLSHDLE